MEQTSPTQHLHSDDDLFDIPVRPSGYETVETVPINRVADSPEHDTLATLHNTQRTQTQNDLTKLSLYARNYTQPTQIIDQSPMTDLSSPPRKPIVQVAASSPNMPSPAPFRKPSGILASAMAPPGTSFRRPTVPEVSEPKQPSWRLPDDFSFSSDSDREEQERNSIKPRTFVSKSAIQQGSNVPQIGNSRDNFSSNLSHFAYDPNRSITAAKRSADVMATAYGGSFKRPRQTGPSRAMPVSQHDATNSDEEEMELEDIRDPNQRNKVNRLLAMKITNSVRICYQALLDKKFNYDDAADHLVLLSERKEKQRKAIDLTGSDDELLMTPAGIKSRSKPALVAKPSENQPKKPLKTIAEKYSSTQTANKATRADSDLRFFDTPPVQPAKKRTLVRGRKDRSSPVRDAEPEIVEKRAPVVVSDDSDDENDSAVLSEPDERPPDFDDRLLDFFNKTTAMDLADIAGIPNNTAEYLVSRGPYNSLLTLQKVEDPNLKIVKKQGKRIPLGERVADKVSEMLHSYDAVDYLVRKCENLAKPLANSMKTWGVDIYGKGSSVGEIDLVSLTDVRNVNPTATENHDSGLGTPISDDDRDAKFALAQKKGFIGQPASIHSSITMKDYQVVGVNWLALLFRQGLSCILADDMGLGKTLQTIAFLAHLNETGVHGPHLIVVPSATLENWLKEFHRFCPNLVVEPYYATIPGERANMRYSIDARRDDINVIITTYTLAKGKEDAPWLKSFGFTCAIFDEGHMLKNVRSQVYKKLIKIKTQFRLLLTGTPLQNNLQELIGLLGFLTPRLFAEKAEELNVIFTQVIRTTTDDASDRERLLSKERIHRARSMLTPFILRRKKWQVLKDLPKKERKIEYCTMTAEQTAVYNSWLQRAWDLKERKARGEHIYPDERGNILLRLRQSAIHPLLFRNFYSLPVLKKIAKQCLKEPMFAESNPDLILEELKAYSDFEVHQLCAKYPAINKFAFKNNEWELSGKVQAMLSLLERFKSEGNKTLIFSQFVMVLDILEVVLTTHKYNYFRLDGNTRVDTRQDLIDEFTASTDLEKGPTVFMLSTKAGGAGINLAAANRVIVFDLGFNPQDDVQAENRAHRIGQTKDVEVWRLITKDSVEEQIHRMGVIKLKLDREVAREAADDLNAEDALTTNGDGTATPADPDDEGLRKELEMQGEATVEQMFFDRLQQQDTVPKVKSSPLKPTSVFKQEKEVIENKPAIKDESSDSKETDDLSRSPSTLKNESNETKPDSGNIKDEAEHESSQARSHPSISSQRTSQRSTRSTKTSTGQENTGSASQSSQQAKKKRSRSRKESGMVQTTIQMINRKK